LLEGRVGRNVGRSWPLFTVHRHLRCLSARLCKRAEVPQKNRHVGQSQVIFSSGSCVTSNAGPHGAAQLYQR
jgi:hypothetical protein